MSDLLKMIKEEKSTDVIDQIIAMTDIVYESKLNELKKEFFKSLNEKDKQPE